MILIGHPEVQSPFFYRINTREQIALTPPNSVILFDYAPSLSHYCRDNMLLPAVHVKHIKELILAYAMGAKYCIVDKSLAINAQKIADDYLFDAKILFLSHDENDIEFAAMNAIDGILFDDGIKTP